jgi:sortase A
VTSTTCDPATRSPSRPYGTFGYVVYGQAIVDDQDWSILRRRPFEKLVLSACHPLYSASRRIVVFARLRR